MIEKLVKLIREEMEKEHPDQEAVVCGMPMYIPWNKFAVSLTDLGYQPTKGNDVEKNNYMKNIIEELHKCCPDLGLSYEVPEGVTDYRHYLETRLERLGKSDHYSIVIHLN